MSPSTTAHRTASVGRTQITPEITQATTPAAAAAPSSAPTPSDEEAALAERPLRRDAARNREMLLEAAHEVFAERGLEASLDEVARRAGLGVGTAYRHFANKRELATAMISQEMERIVADGLRALQNEDPWEALVTFIEQTCWSQSANRGLHEAMVGTVDLSLTERVRDAFLSPITEVLERGKRMGEIRADAEPSDIVMIFAMLGITFEIDPDPEHGLWRRYLALLLDGLRATERPRLPAKALEVEETATVLLMAKRRQGC